MNSQGAEMTKAVGEAEREREFYFYFRWIVV